MSEKTGCTYTGILSAFSVKKLVPVCILTTLIFIIFQNYHHLKNWKYLKRTEKDGNKFCPIRPPDLVRRFTPDISPETIESVEKRFEKVLELGGYFKPKECQARDRVAILVTCRGRDGQLPIFLKNLHPVLMRQQLEYQIFVISQAPGYLFNKGALYNAGYIEAMKISKWDCVVFHDIDMVPMDDRNLYDCPRVNPRHMAVDVDKFGFKLLRVNYFSGVFVLTADQYQQVSGHSNSFWGWGGEDNDLYNRVMDAGYFLERYPHQITRYKSVFHSKSIKNPEWWGEVQRGKNLFNETGLNSLKYHVDKVEKKRTLTHILVRLIPEEVRLKTKSLIDGGICSDTHI